MGPRGAGRRLSDQERMEIIEIMSQDTKIKNVEIAKRYGVSEGAIRKLKIMKDSIRDRYYVGNEQNRDKRKRGGFQRNAKFEQELYDWICTMRETQTYQMIPLTQAAVRQQAILLAKNYESLATFKASPGWFARFCSRHRLDPPRSDVVSVDPNMTAAQQALVLGTGGTTVPASAYQVVDTGSLVFGDTMTMETKLEDVKPEHKFETDHSLHCEESIAIPTMEESIPPSTVPSSNTVESPPNGSVKDDLATPTLGPFPPFVSSTTEEIFSLGL